MRFNTRTDGITSDKEEAVKKTIAILGLGRFGQFLTRELSANGADLLVADSDEKLVNQYAGMVSDAVVADLTDPEAIKNIGLGDMDNVIVSMGSSLEASIMCVMVAKEAGVKHVVAKAASERMGEVLRRVGADQIIYPEKESAVQTARILLSSNFLDYFRLGDDLCVISMEPKPEWCGKSLSELRLRNRYRINVLAIRHGGALTANIDPSMPLSQDMQLLVVTEAKNLHLLKD